MGDLTIVYYTDNRLDRFLLGRCQEYLTRAAGGRRIITVSQEPLDFGDNVCLGPIGRSHISLFTQALEGARRADTRYIALAEHDCLYTAGHFNWRPPDDGLFWYNVNHWLVQWGGEYAGMYSFYRRKVLSNLICSRELFIEAIEEKLEMLRAGAEVRKGQPGACEPGVCDNRAAFRAAKAELYKDVGKDRRNYRAKAFATAAPNIDIRHGRNFSGGRRARKRRYSLAPWGSFHAVMGVMPPGKWYQEAVINGRPVPTIRSRDTNEGRWARYVRPLVEPGSGTVTDLGCNAGFYCRKLAGLGYTPTGVERDHVALRHAYWWEAQEPAGVRIVEGDIAGYDPACSQYVLLANVHYWLAPEQLAALVERLRERALRVIVIGRYRTAPEHGSPAGPDELRLAFAGWREEGFVTGGKHYSVRFANQDLDAARVADIFLHQGPARSARFLPSYRALIDAVAAGEDFDPARTEYADYLRWRRFKDREQMMARHVELVRTMMEHGQPDPVTMAGGRLVDGDHRLIVAERLGMEWIIYRNKGE